MRDMHTPEGPRPPGGPRPLDAAADAAKPQCDGVDLLRTPKKGKRLVRRVSLPGTDHCAHLELTGRFADELTRFLKR